MLLCSQLHELSSFLEVNRWPSHAYSVVPILSSHHESLMIQDDCEWSRHLIVASLQIEHRQLQRALRFLLLFLRPNNQRIHCFYSNNT